MKKILITGGELGNKGAQAMTFITVCETKKRYPAHEIILVSYNDCRLPSEERERYQFRIEPPSSMVYPLYRMGGLFKAGAILGRHTKEEQKRRDELFGNADALIDVSGYALGSNWGPDYCLNYLNSILIAKAYKIPCFLMPQSFGPFNFKGIKGRFVEWFMKRLLRYPKVIYAREQEGFDLLTGKYGLKNVKLSCDLVLNNSAEPKPGDVYKNPPSLHIPEIKERSVGIVPNQQNFKYGNRDEVLAVYTKIVENLIGVGRFVYLLRHSAEDLEICRAIKSRFSSNDLVQVLDGDFSCFEFNAFVDSFDFLIASRFHSVVHAYKKAVPCIVLGWAIKYRELAALFDQTEYMFDVREQLDLTGIIQALERMSSAYKEESDKIRTALPALQANNVYDVIEAVR